MSDVRSLLRSERASRRINHPQASYTPDGRIVCKVCHVQLKAESLWDAHLRSPNHRGNLLRSRPQGRLSVGTTPIPTAATSRDPSKKRRADDEAIEARKKMKSALFEEQAPPSEPQVHLPLTEEGSGPLPKSITPSDFYKTPVPASASGSTPQIDEAEWAAFERDIATPPPSPPRQIIPTVLNTDAIIVAAPMTAQEIAIRATEEASHQKKSLREAEIEGEAEDARLRLQEEFEQMEEYEERVRKLKELRESIRGRKSSGHVRNVEMTEADTEGSMAVEEGGIDDVDRDSGNESDDEDEGDDWDEWGFRAD